MPIQPPDPIDPAPTVRGRHKKISGFPERTEGRESFFSDDPLVPLPVIDLESPEAGEGPADVHKLHVLLGLIVDKRV